MTSQSSATSPSADASQSERQSPTPGKDESLFVGDDDSGDEGMYGDFDDDQEADGATTGYDESTEPFPKAAIYDPEFKQLHTDTSQLLAQLIETVPEASRDLGRFKLLLGRARQLSRFPATRKRRINLVGKSGSGKSSLLNSLLGLPGHAKALAGSKACTHVPTTYEGAFVSQERRFAVRIEFFAPDEVRKMIEISVSNYYEFYDGDNNDLMEEERMEIQTAADTALETFRTLFSRKHAFATPEKGQEFLDQGSGNDRAKQIITEKFVRWCVEIIGTSGISSQEYYQTNNEDELRSFIQQFAFSSPSSDKCSVWPLVKCIREGVAGVEILNYVSLVDWPGSDDTNQLRAQASAQRIYECDEIWIVSSADRIATDPAATINLIRYAKVTPCLMVCTSIDDKIDKSLVEEMAEDGYDIGDYRESLAAEARLQAEIKQLENQDEKLSKILNRGWVQTKPHKRKQLTQDLRGKFEQDQRDINLRVKENRTKVFNTQQARFELAVQVRKRYILDLITKKNLKRHTKNGELEVFFASNTHYERHKMGTLEMGPTLSIPTTGIPNMRQHLLQEAAPRELEMVKNFLNHDVKLLINGIGLVTNTVDPQGCEEALQMVEQKQADIDREQKAFLSSLGCYIDTNITQPLATDQDSHTSSALDVLKEKEEWAYASIRAFVRNRGCYHTKAKPYHSWTEEFMQEAVKDLTKAWSDYMEADEVAGLREDLESVLVEQCRLVVEALNHHESSFRIQQDDFQGFMEGQVGKIEQACKKFENKLVEALGHIFIQATQANAGCPTGYFFQALGQAWDESKGIEGTGAKARILTVFETHLKLPGDRSPFAVLRNDMAKAILGSAKEFMAELTTEVKAVLTDIHDWLRMMFYKEVEDPEEIEALKLLEKFQGEARNRYLAILDDLAGLEKRYR